MADTRKKEEVTLETLAHMVAKGFANTASKSDVDGLGNDMGELKNDMTGLKDDITGLKNDVGELKTKIDHTDARIARIETDIQTMRGNIVYQDDFDDLTARVKNIESKLGIESGR